MKHWLYEWAGRLRAVAQHLPVVGTVAGSVSLERSPAPDTVVEKIKICDGERIDLANDRAVPRELSYAFADKHAYVLRNVTLWPELGVVVDGRRRIIEASAFSPPRLEYLRGRGMFRPYPMQEVTGLATTLHVGPYWDNYYHGLVDSLPRVFALHAPRVAELGRIKLLVCGKLSEDRRRLLAALLPANVDMVPVPARTRIRPESFLLLPFLAGDCAGYLPADYLKFFRERAFAAFGIRPDVHPRRRILISRRMATTRRLTNQNELETALLPLGFETVDLEVLSLAEQMQRFAEAECVVGAHGAGLTNLLFSPPCKVLELFAGPPKTHYRLLAAAGGHAYANLVVGDAQKNSDFAAPVEAILERLQVLGIVDR